MGDIIMNEKKIGEAINEDNKELEEQVPSEEVKERLEKMKLEIIEEMVESGWNREVAEEQAEAFW